MFIRSRGGEEPKVDMTPMVDVVFLLLIFFMISTTFVEAPGIDVNLPQSSSQKTTREAKEVKVYVDRHGQVSIGDKPVSLENLERELGTLRGKQQAPTFVLLADREVRHGEVVRIMDAAQAAGFTRLAIGTEPLKEKQP